MKLALFDLDNTLLKGDSDFEWSQFLIRIGVLNKELFEVKNLSFYEDYKNGCLDIYAFLDFQLKPLADHSRAQLDQWHQQFMSEQINGMITDNARTLVNKHLAAGDECLIITATNSFVTSPIAKEFGIEHLIATEPEHQNGEFTGKVSGTPSFREGKITRLQAWLAEHNKTIEDYDSSTFYSDSLNDLPLLQLVSHPVAVNPDPTLRQHAEQHLWPIIDLHKNL